ncbi:MAG: hypothetical protein HY820_23485 [Acidobacteria bacterium]|nr:hypothetical protein [Acidobacteriota bacterium]
MKMILTLAAMFCATCPGADGDGTCSVKDFRGTYGFTARGTNVTNNTPIAFAGTLTADGNGKITAWKDWVSVPADPPITPPNFKVVPPVRDIVEQARSLGNEILYTVEADCRMTITTAVPGPAPGIVIPVAHVGALVAKGKEAMLINGAPGSPYHTVTQMKHVSE